MISIAMTTYNGEKYLREQIDSILAQTIQDFELVVCDDCSKDSTWEILEDYAKKDNRVQIHENYENIGFLKNFEKAIELCHGDYIALSDQDDIWTEYHLEVLLNTIGDKVLACGNSLLVDESGNSMGMTLKEQESLDYIPRNDFKKLMSILLFRNPYQGSSMMFRSSFVSQLLPIPEQVLYHDTWIAAISCLNGGLVYVDDVILYYRRLKTSVTGIRSDRRRKWEFFRNRWFIKSRPVLIDELLNRSQRVTMFEKKNLQYMKKMIERSDDLNGSRRNIIYLLLHYKTIYSCDFKHWL